MLKLEQRPQPSKVWTYASPILALLITVVIGVCLFALLGKDPVRPSSGSPSSPATRWVSSR